jgi:hypothetical protein
MACCEIVRYDPALLVRMEREGSKVARKASGCVGLFEDRAPSNPPIGDTMAGQKTDKT